MYVRAANVVVNCSCTCVHDWHRANDLPQEGSHMWSATCQAIQSVEHANADFHMLIQLQCAQQG